LAETHAIAEPLPRFFVGVLGLATTPLPLAAAVGLGGMVAFASAAAVRLAICAATLSSFVFAAFDATAFSGAPTVAVIASAGVASVLGWNPPAWFSLLLGLATGAVAATALTAVQYWDAALGLGATVVVISGCTATSLRYARTFPPLRDAVPIARRVIGAWGTAIAMLLAKSS
jgi:hypothetical protein